LAEHGLAGATMFLFFVLGIFIQIFRIRNHQARETIVVIGLGSLLLAIMFPLKPSGSFFSTFNASMLFYIFGFFLYYLKKVK
jgi:O-antigen ligase